MTGKPNTILSATYTWSLMLKKMTKVYIIGDRDLAALQNNAAIIEEQEPDTSPSKILKNENQLAIANQTILDFVEQNDWNKALDQETERRKINANIEEQAPDVLPHKSPRDENKLMMLNQTFLDVIGQDDSYKTLEEENEHHKIKANKRFEEFKKILFGTKIQVGWLKFVFNIFGTLLTTVVMTIPLALIPVHNVFHHPAYWYETPLQGTLNNASMGIYYVFICGYFLNISYIKNARNFLIMCLVGVLQTWIVYTAAYYIWTHILKFQYPVPFVGFIATIIIYLPMLTTLWFRFPSNWRKNKLFRRRLKFCFLAFGFCYVILFPYNILVKLFDMIQNEYQPIIALSLPAIRELNLWILTKLIGNAAMGDIIGAKLVGSHLVSTWHATFLCFTIGSLATDITSWVIMGLDFFINLSLSVRLVWMKRRRPNDIEKQYELLLEIVLTELIEFLVPLAFLLTFIVSYYGPNSTLIGNVGSSYWQYNAVKDGEQYVKNILIFFFVDFCSGVASAIIFKVFCKINLAKAFVILEKEFALCFSVQLGILVLLVSSMI